MTMIDAYLLIMDIVVAAVFGYCDFYNIIKENLTRAAVMGILIAFILFALKAIINYRVVDQQFWETHFLTLFIGPLFGAISSMITVKVKSYFRLLL